MPTRKRIRNVVPVVQGSGGSVPTYGNVEWGPNFGELQELTVGSSVSFAEAAVGNIRTVGATAQLAMAAALYQANAGGTVSADEMVTFLIDAVGASVQIAEVAVWLVDSVGATAALAALDAVFGVGAGASILLSAVDPAYLIDAAGATISGSGLGAPIVETTGTGTTSTNATSVTVTAPSGIQSGDLLVAFIGRNNVADDVALAGWTKQRHASQTGCGMTCLTKVAGGSEPGSYAFAWGSASAGIGTVVRVSAVDGTTPVNVHLNGNGSAADPVSPDITTTVDNCLKLSGCVQVNTVNADYTPPASYTEVSDLNGNGTAGLLAITGEVAWRHQATAGASGTVTHDSTQGLASAYACVHIAIAPGSFDFA